jgi:hypothetical protein
MWWKYQKSYSSCTSVKCQERTAKVLQGKYKTNESKYLNQQTF